MDAWNGKPLTLFTVRTQTPDGTPTKGIRVRCPGQQPGKTNPVQQPDFSSESLPDDDELPFFVDRSAETWQGPLPFFSGTSLGDGCRDRARTG